MPTSVRSFAKFVPALATFAVIGAMLFFRFGSVSVAPPPAIELPALVEPQVAGPETSPGSGVAEQDLAATPSAPAKKKR